MVLLVLVVGDVLLILVDHVPYTRLDYARVVQ